MVTHIAPDGGAGDSDAWGIDLLLLHTSSEDPEEQSLHEELKGLVRKRVANFAAWQERTESWIKGTGGAFIAYAFTTGTLAVTNVLEHGLWSDAALVGGAVLFIGLITAVTTRIVGGTLYKLSVGFDREVLLQSKIAAVRGQRDTQRLNTHLAAVQRQLVGVNAHLADQAQAMRALRHHFLEGGDREASRILERHEEILAGRTPPAAPEAAANVRPFPPSPTRRLR